MSKKYIFILLAIAFISGLLLREIFVRGISIGKHLRFSDSKSIMSKERPILEFLKLDIPKEVTRGSSFTMNAYFRPLRRIEGNYKMFIHLYTGNRQGWINADRYPIPATRDWPENQITEIGPIQIFIPDDAPLGKYVIDLGLFKTEKGDDDEVKYIRLPYTNIKGHNIIGTINVVKEKIVSEKVISINLEKEAMKIFGLKDYTLAVDTGVNKIFRDISKFNSPISNALNISLAKNEYEAGQIIIIPIESDLKNIEIYVGDLKDKQGNLISVKNIKFNLVGYVPTHKPDYPTPFVGSWPDPLEGMRKFNVLKGEVQPVWITLFAPQDTIAGNYTANIIIKPENLKPLNINLNVHVYDFTLPLKPHLNTAFDIYTEYIARLYQISGNDFKNMLRKYILNLIEHRINPIYTASLPKEYHDKFGYLVLDFSEFDQDIEFFINHGLNTFGIGQFGGSHDNKWSDSEYVSQVFLNYAEHLKAAGWIDRAYIYTYDEPTPKDAEVVKRITSLIHSVSKELKNLVTIIPDERWGDDIDIWCPQLVDYNREIADKERAKGKKVWVYVSSPRPPSPTFIIDTNAIDARIIPWIIWKEKIDGLLYFCVNRWQVNPWEDAMTWPKQNGSGSLIYPGENGPVNSIRWECLRDGMEDYEYLYLLSKAKEKIEELGLPVDEELLNQANILLNINDAVVKNKITFTKDPRILLGEREKIGNYTERLIKILKERMQKQKDE